MTTVLPLNLHAPLDGSCPANEYEQDPLELSVKSVMSESFDQCPTISDVETEDEDEWDDPPLVLLDSEFAPLPAIPIIMAMMKIPTQRKVSHHELERVLAILF